MIRWRKAKQEWKKPLDGKTKVDIQEIVNKHQASALLEANDTIRALEDQREEHLAILAAQQDTINNLEAQVQKYLAAQRNLLLTRPVSPSSAASPEPNDALQATIIPVDKTTNDEPNKEVKKDDHGESSYLHEQLRDLKRQLHERDVLIQNLQQGNEAVSAPSEAKEDEAEISWSRNAGSMKHALPNGSQELEDSDQSVKELRAEISSLKDKVSSLTIANKGQEIEIEKLQNILQEMEEFHAITSSTPTAGAQSPASHGTRSSFGLETIQESSSILSDSSEISEGSDNHHSSNDGKQLINAINPLQHNNSNMRNGTIEQSDEDSSFLEAESEIDITIDSDPAAESNNSKVYRGMTLQGNQLVLLISSMPVNPMVAANQSRLETVLQGYLNFSCEKEVQVLDGCDQDPASVTLRNDLFRISGLHAQYPQLFLVNFAKNDISFVGGFADIMELHDTQKFAETIGLIPY